MRRCSRDASRPAGNGCGRCRESSRAVGDRLGRARRTWWRLSLTTSFAEFGSTIKSSRSKKPDAINWESAASRPARRTPPLHRAQEEAFHAAAVLIHAAAGGLRGPRSRFSGRRARGAGDRHGKQTQIRLHALDRRETVVD